MADDDELVNDDARPGESMEEWADRVDAEEADTAAKTTKKRLLNKPQKVSEYWDPNMGIN